MRRPPRSTLFPYPTLFRSHHETCCCRRPRGRRGLKQLIAHHVDQDRKSTRLNSSHLGSSYGVFCLKKEMVKHMAPLLLSGVYPTPRKARRPVGGGGASRGPADESPGWGPVRVARPNRLFFKNAAPTQPPAFPLPAHLPV